MSTCPQMSGDTIRKNRLPLLALAIVSGMLQSNMNIWFVVLYKKTHISLFFKIGWTVRHSSYMEKLSSI